MDFDEIWKIKNTFESPKEEQSKGCVNKSCSSSTFLLEENLIICTTCNTVQDKSLDASAEWRFFGSENSSGKDPSRCGMPTNDLLPEGSMTTFVGHSYGKCTYDMMKISRYQLWNAVPYKERSYYSATEHIMNVATNNGISESIINEAKMLLRKVSEYSVSRGENRKGMLACSIYTACIMNNVPRSVKEIADHFGVTTACITKMSKKFQEAFPQSKFPTPKASDFIPRYCSELDIKTDKCFKVVGIIDENSLLHDVSPMSCVAGCIFIVNKIDDLKLEKAQIAKVCGVSEVTINKVCKKLAGYMQFIYDKLK